MHDSPQLKGHALEYQGKPVRTARGPRTYGIFGPFRSMHGPISLGHASGRGDVQIPSSRTFVVKLIVTDEGLGI